MNRDDIMRMAREAGFHPIPFGIVEVNLLSFAALVAAAEREACARTAENWDSDSADPRDIADAIRARGTP